MSTIDLFSDASDRYAAARPRYPRELYQFLSSLVNPGDQPSEPCDKTRVWDCATGNGQAAIGLAEFFTEVYATDVSPQQIAHAMAGDNITYSVQPAESTHFGNHFFDVVVVAQALHWFDLEQFWLEVKRVLKPGGIFAAWGYDWFVISPEIDSIVKHDVDDVIAPFWSPRLQSLWSGYSDIDCPFEPIATPPFEIEMRWRLSDLMAYLDTWSATRQYVQQHGDAFLKLAEKKLMEVWGNPDQPKIATMKMSLMVRRNL